MTRMTEWRSLAACALLATGAPGCFAVANLDRFEIEPALCESTSAMTRDYRWRLTTFDPHQGRRFEMKVVDATTGRVAAGIVYDPIPDGRPTTLGGVVPVARGALGEGATTRRRAGRRVARIEAGMSRRGRVMNVRRDVPPGTAGGGGSGGRRGRVTGEGLRLAGP